MYDKIFEFATKNKLQLKHGWKEKYITAYIKLDNESNFLGIETKDSKDKEKTLVPDIGTLAFGPNCNFIVEKAKYIFDKSNVKYENYITLLEKASDFNNDVKIIYKFMKKFNDDEKFEERILKELKNENLIETSKDPFISFKINGINIEEISNWHFWYDEFYLDITKKDSNNNKTISLVSGKEVNAHSLDQPFPIIYAPCTGKGDYVFSLGNKSFKSYDQNFFPLSTEEAEKIKLGFEKLLKPPHYNNKFRLLHWYKNGNVENNIINMFLSNISDEDENDNEDEEEIITDKNDQKLYRMINSVLNNEHPDNSIINDTFYTAKYTSCGGRFFLSDQREGNVKDLYINLKNWFDDCKIGDKKDININGIFFNLINNTNAEKKLEQVDKEFGQNKYKLLNSAFYGDDIPKIYFQRAIEHIKKDFYEKDQNGKNKNKSIKTTYIQIIKMYLIRKQRKRGICTIMKDLNENENNIAYNCGRLFAVYAKIQYDAQGELNSDIVNSYFAAAQTHPAYIFGKLSKLSNHHLKKIQRENIKVFDNKLLEEIASKIDCFPKTLTLEEQGMFALGYYQQKKDFFNKEDKKDE